MSKPYLIAATLGALFVCPLGAGASADPCSLITQSQASSYLGAPALPGKRHASRVNNSCRWYSANHQMNVYIAFSQMKVYQGLKSYGGKPVSGVGNGAVFSGGSIFLLKGSTVMQVSVIRSAADMSAPSSQAIALAKVVAAKL